MLKIVVFDSGYGGDLFAEQLKEALPIIKIIRVIDWRNAEIFLSNPRASRIMAEDAIRPYIGRVDLIIFANYMLSATSLKYFEKKYQTQKFLGLSLPKPSTNTKYPVVLLTNKTFAHTINFYNYIFKLKNRTNILCLDTWISLIDDGELTDSIVAQEFEKFYIKYKYRPTDIILLSSHFNDIIPNLRQALGRNIKIYSGFSEAIEKTGKILKIRGGTGKRKH